MKQFFYGWWVLVGLFLMYAGSSIGVSTFPTLNAELREIHGWTHAEVSTPPSYLYFFIAGIAFLSGSLIDRYGPRLMIIVGSICNLTSIVLFYFVDTIPMLTLVYFIFSIGITNTGVLSGMTIITRWFRKYKGMAAGILTTGSSLAGIIFPKLMGNMIAQYDLKTAVLVLLGAGSIFIIVPLFFIKDNPSDVGQEIDGLPKQETQSEAINSKTLPQNTSLTEAFGTIQFYMILFITGAMWLVINTLVQHLPLFLKDLKIGLAEAGTVQSIFFTFSLMGKFTFGWLSDKFGKKPIMILAGINMCLGCTLMLIAIGNPLLLYAAVLVYGIGFSGTFTMVQLLVAEYYTGIHYGKILGVVITVDNLAGALGIRLLGTWRTADGNYEFGFMFMLGLCALATVCTLLLKKPHTSHG